MKHMRIPSIRGPISEKTGLFISLLGMLVMILAVCIFSNTDSLLMMPLTTPDQFLSGMPHAILPIFGADLVLIQPSSTFFVYFLGVIMILIGIYFLATKMAQRSRYYWGIGLVLWGISALLQEQVTRRSDAK